MNTNQTILSALRSATPCWSAIGFTYEDPDRAVRYFCTPKGAEIFGSLGVDGIHYCTIPALGEYVFMVIPMPADDRYVLPVADNIEHFFSLVAALHGTQLMDQLVTWDRDTFNNAFCRLLEEEDSSRAEELAAVTALIPCTPATDPYGEIRARCDAFNPACITYTPEYYETLGLTPREKKEESWDFVSTITRWIPRKD